MPFKLMLSEEVTPAVRRIALEQLKRARRSISAEQNMQAGVHEARKNFKRLRALVGLARPILGNKIYRQENRDYRTMSRSIARPRTLAALLDTLRKFEHREDMHGLDPLFCVLHAHIEAEKKIRESEVELLALGGFVERLDIAAERWTKMRLRDAGFEELAHGFAESYGRARASLQKAMQEEQIFYLHEWRKDMQKTWRQMQIFTLIWPEDIMPRIKLAREISQLLGTAHDIEELLHYIQVNKKQLRKQKGIKRQIKAFRQASEAVQRDLSLHAIERGRRLYAFKPKAIESAMVTYWQSAKALQPMPGVALELAEVIPLDKSPSRSAHRSEKLTRKYSDPKVVTRRRPPA